MGFRSWILASAVMLWACGDDTTAGGDTDGTTMSPSSSDPSTTAPATTASETTASSSVSTTTSADTTASSSDATTASTTGDTGSSSAADTSSSSESSGDSGQGNVQYRAVALIGGLNRVRIMKRNDDADTCTFVSLVDPGFKGGFGDIDITEPWGFEFGGITDSAAACDSDNPAMFDSNTVIVGEGAIVLEDAGIGGVPCGIDLDVTLTFDDTNPALPEMDDMTATDLPVQGC